MGYKRRSDLNQIKRLPLLEVAARLGIRPTKRNSARCPFPGHNDLNPSFVLYPKTNTCWCFACSRGGSVIDLVAISQGCSVADAIRWLCQSYDLDAMTNHGHRLLPSIVEDTARSKPPAQEHTSEFAPNTAIYEALLMGHPMGGTAAAYLTQRGFSGSTISHFRLGFLSNAPAAALRLIADYGQEAVYRSGILRKNSQPGNLIFPAPSVLFPFIEGERVVYVQSRTLPGTVGARWMGPRGIKKPIYNVDTILQSSTVYICEGVTDVISAYELGIAAIGILGSASRPSQNVLRSLRQRTVYTLPDRDEAGTLMATRLAKILRSFGIQSVTKYLPVGNDLNEYLLLTRQKK